MITLGMLYALIYTVRLSVIPTVFGLKKSGGTDAMASAPTDTACLACNFNESILRNVKCMIENYQNISTLPSKQKIVC